MFVSAPPRAPWIGLEDASHIQSLPPPGLATLPYKMILHSHPFMAQHDDSQTSVVLSTDPSDADGDYSACNQHAATNYDIAGQAHDPEHHEAAVRRGASHTTASQ